MKLPDRLARRLGRPFHSAIVTSFAVEFAAVEEILLPQLMASGATNILLLTDERMAAMSLSDGSRLPNALGRDYAMHSPLANEGIFHPKIILQLGREGGRAIISSANATAAGLGGNAEVAIEIAGEADDSAGQEIIRAIWQYVDALVPEGPSPGRDALRWARERSPWLNGPTGQSLKELEDGTAIAFLSSPAERGILDEFADLVGDDKVEILMVISPYWDTDLATLSDLSDRLNPGELIVPLDSQQHEFPTSAPFAKKPRLVEMRWPSHRFTHAKIIVAVTAERAHLLVGSANCTRAAMGGRRRGVQNAEACIYRRLPKEAAIEALSLDWWIDAEPVALADLAERVALPEVPLNALEARRPGTFELDEGTLIWTPPADRERAGEVELLNRTGVQIGVVGTGAFTPSGQRLTAAVDPGLQAKLHFARVRLGEFLSTTAHVAHRQLLRNNRREAASGHIAKALAHFSDGGGFELWMHQAFETLVRADFSTEDGEPAVSAARARPTREKDEHDQPVLLSYDEFTEARAKPGAGASNGSNSLAGTYTDSVRAFLNLLSGRNAAPAPHDDDEDWLGVDEEAEEPVDRPDEPDPEEPVDHIEPAPVDARLYEKHVSAYAESLEAGEEQLGSADVLRLRYWLLFLLYKARCEALPKGLESSSDARSWPRFIVRLLVAFFCGRAPAVSRLMIAREYTEMPVDFMECWITALWGLEAIETLTPNSAKNQAFLKHLPELLRRIVSLLGLSAEEIGGDLAKQIRDGLDSSIGIRLGVGASTAENDAA